MKILKRIGFFLLVIFVGGYAYISWTLSNRILETGSSMELTKSRIVNQWGSTLEEMEALLPTPADFVVTSFDETKIAAKYYQKSDSAQCALILAHGWSSNWAGMLKYVPALSDCNCDLVLYDHRAHGDSGGKYPTGGIKEAKDLIAVTEWVQNEKGYTLDQIGWFGASWGAATVLEAGAENTDVAFIIADSPFQDWYSAIFERAERQYGILAKAISFGVMQMVNWRAGINYKEASALKAAEKIKEPVLLIHSKTDEATSSLQSVNISKKLNPSNSEFHHLDWGGGHTQDVLINAERFKALINHFIAKVDQGFCH